MIQKACPGLDPGWEPVFGKDHAQTKSQTLIHFNLIGSWSGGTGSAPRAHSFRVHGRGRRVGRAL
jgi:hypothetical protein